MEDLRLHTNTYKKETLYLFRLFVNHVTERPRWYVTLFPKGDYKTPKGNLHPSPRHDPPPGREKRGCEWATTSTLVEILKVQGRDILFPPKYIDYSNTLLTHCTHLNLRSFQGRHLRRVISINTTNVHSQAVDSPRKRDTDSKQYWACGPGWNPSVSRTIQLR